MGSLHFLIHAFVSSFPVVRMYDFTVFLENDFSVFSLMILPEVVTGVPI